ncbi:hypothetical protein LCGC14_2926060 [marine sediment metagenome]|uniref:Uncharacterized protein n=1 Tax=marine sediment metagenome TaxID=412755 RepID=A0A0F9ADD5_9ZZZZ
MNDHDLLIRIDVKLDSLYAGFTNHLKHHFRYNIMAWTVTLGAIISLILIVVGI